ncbi:MAG: DsbA family protein [Asticcacaulis sp.]|nr:DsbA family protein [Asticcacaulis sp.]
MTLTRILYPIMVSAALVCAPYAALAKAKAAKAPTPAAPVTAAVLPAEPGLLPDMTLGNPKAPVTVVEYASAACPHCAAWNKENWPAFRDKYVATGKVKYVFRELLTNPAEYALAGFLIGRCAVAQSKTPQSSANYFTVVDTFFKNQATGLSTMKQLDCVTDQGQIDAFYKTMNTHAEADKIHSTPTFIVNGKTVEGHEMKDIDAAIAAAAK